MSRELVVGVVGLVLLLVLLGPAEHGLLKLMDRHLNRSRRVIRAFLFLAGVAAWAYLSYVPLYQFNRQWWFISFLIVAGVWKLVVDVLIFGVQNAKDSVKPTS